MKIYELTYIISSQITSQEAEGMSKDIESFIQNKEGVILRVERISLQTLSFPIKKQSSGYFVVVELQIPEANIKGLEERIEKDHKILRHLIVVKKPAKALKARRGRSPMFIGRNKDETVFSKVPVEKVKEEKAVSIEEIDKKLDEILSE